MPVITVKTDLHPEDNAMLQALYSRSPKPVSEHLKKLEAGDSGDFMGKFYVGYGHKSIGDCGTVTIFIEGVSMLAAKAIQQYPLYNGQEASTRYMDFGNAAAYSESHWMDDIQASLFRLYSGSLDQIRDRLAWMVPGDSQERDRALKAWTFDVARSILPAGTLTNLSWHTTLSAARDHLKWLSCCGMKEVESLALSLHSELRKVCPSSFSEDIGNDQYLRDAANATWWVDSSTPHGFESRIREIPSHMLELLKNRPKRALLPRDLNRLGTIEASFCLDFGSYRDLQRHRNMTLTMPLLTPRSVNQWYLSMLPEPVMNELEVILQRIRSNSATNPRSLQYVVPMGCNVNLEASMTLPQAVYVAELRSGTATHPTLRSWAQDLGGFVSNIIDPPGSFRSVEIDTRDVYGSFARGSQTITEK